MCQCGMTKLLCSSTRSSARVRATSSSWSGAAITSSTSSSIAGSADAGDVLAAVLARLGAGPVVALLVARGEALAHRIDRHVVVEGVDAHLVLRGIHRAHARRDAQALEPLHIGQRHAFEGRRPAAGSRIRSAGPARSPGGGRARVQPASRSRASARRAPSRLLPDPSVTGRLVFLGEDGRRGCGRGSPRGSRARALPAGRARRSRNWRRRRSCAHRRRRTGWCSSTRSRTPRSGRGARAHPGTAGGAGSPRSTACPWGSRAGSPRASPGCGARRGSRSRWPSRARRSRCGSRSARP